nr:MAG TPA: protein of unknown function (DUF4516) [Caudoviricetes sp.]
MLCYFLKLHAIYITCLFAVTQVKHNIYPK